jgi:hypothetical protein
MIACGYHPRMSNAYRCNGCGAVEDVDGAVFALLYAGGITVPAGYGGAHAYLAGPTKPAHWCAKCMKIAIEAVTAATVRTAAVRELRTAARIG